MALNCETLGAQRAAGKATVNGEPCGECVSCQRIWSGSSSLDVIEIDAASNRGVDDARELRERAMYAPSGDQRYKVYIVDEAHMLTREAWNALLKILEEPPPRVVFVFATTEPQKIAQTAAPVLSRLQRFDLKRIGASDIRERLAVVLREENVKAEDDAIGLISRAADGSMRDALSLTDQALALGDGTLSAERVRESLGLIPDDELLGLLDMVAEHRAADVFRAVGRLSDEGVDFGVVLAGFTDVVRAQLAVELGGVPEDVSERMRDALRERKGKLGAPDLLRMMNIINEMELRFRRSGQQRILVETMLVRMALMDRAVDIDKLIRGLGGSRSGGGGVDAEPRPAPRRASAPEPPSPGVGAPPRAERPQAMTVQPGLADGPPTPKSIKHPPAAAVSAGVPDLSKVTEVWDEVVNDLRSRRALLATVLERCMPRAITGAGVLTLDIPDDAATHAINAAQAEILEVIRQRLPGVSKLSVPSAAESKGPASRITAESVREDRIARMRKADPVLDAALDELDLDLVE
jgi:DNA polymerase III subunit gamma/tau